MSYLQYSDKFLDDSPFIVFQSIFAEIGQFLVASNLLDGLPVLDRKTQHVMCGVPPCDDISWD